MMWPAGQSRRFLSEQRHTPRCSSLARGSRRSCLLVHGYSYTGRARTTLMAVVGLSVASVATFPIRLMTSMPLLTRPKMVCCRQRKYGHQA